MSRIGKIPIKLPKNVKIKYDGTILNIEGQFGILTREIPNIFNIKIKNDILYLELKDHKFRKYRALHGLYRTLISNMVTGVYEQFKLTLKLNGIGYKAVIEKNTITLNLGYSHTIKKVIPSEIQVNILQNTNIVLKSCDKEKLGLFASKIRSYRKPEPYKGKGILFDNELIIFKKGKINKK